MSKAIPVNMKANVNDFERIEKRLAQIQRELAEDAELTQAQKGKIFMLKLGHYTGPATGLVWDDETGKISIAPGWHADADGNVVKD